MSPFDYTLLASSCATMHRSLGYSTSNFTFTCSTSGSPPKTVNFSNLGIQGNRRYQTNSFLCSALPLVGQFKYPPLSHFEHMPFARRLLLKIMYKYDVIHKLEEHDVGHGQHA